MARMFFGCSSLTELDLSNFNTENVTNMQDMFFGCSKLTELDLSNFNTENVTNMISMFRDCSSLTNLNLSSFDTRNVTDFGYMFVYANNINRITIGENYTLSFPNKTWYDEEGNSYTATEISELENPAGTYYAVNPKQ